MNFGSYFPALPCSSAFINVQLSKNIPLGINKMINFIFAYLVSFVMFKMHTVFCDLFDIMENVFLGFGGK